MNIPISFSGLLHAKKKKVLDIGTTEMPNTSIVFAKIFQKIVELVRAGHASP
jgi:hypothetical protein